MRKTGRKKYILFFFTALVCMVSLTACRENGPEIHSIDPQIGRMGDIIIILGSGFGDERNESYVTIAGTSPVSSSYLSWNDGEIIVRLPEFGDAGLIHVHRGKNKSNPALFVNQLSLPVPISRDEGNGPRITSIQPASGPIGSLITIRGSNFGISRKNSGVFFAWDAEHSPALAGINPPNFVEVSEAEFGYELWSEREIRVRVPNGAISGDIELRTPRGNSRSVFFEITGMPGTKTYRDSRSLTFSYTVEIEIETAVSPNVL